MVRFPGAYGIVGLCGHPLVILPSSRDPFPPISQSSPFCVHAPCSPTCGFHAADKIVLIILRHHSPDSVHCPANAVTPFLFYG